MNYLTHENLSIVCAFAQYPVGLVCVALCLMLQKNTHKADKTKAILAYWAAA